MVLGLNPYDPAEMTDDLADGSMVEKLAREYQVSRQVIENQLQNADVDVVVE